MIVKMLVHTGRPGEPLSPGDLYDVDKVTAKFWIENGIAAPVKKTRIISKGQVVKKEKKRKW